MAKSEKNDVQYTEQELREALAEMIAHGMVKESVNADGEKCYTMNEAALNSLQNPKKGK